MQEPASTAVILAVTGALALVSALFGRAVGRFGLPVNLAFLALGMIAGLEDIGFPGLATPDFAFRLGTIALVLILFDGGFNTSLAAVRTGIWPAGLLATFGVALTAAVLGLFAHLLGFGWLEAFLLGSIVSSTDAAAVFAVLRHSGLQLKRRVAVTLELESGLNDPMAVLLTIAFTGALSGGAALSPWLAAEVVFQLAVGGLLGAAFGWGGRWLLARARLPAAGLYPVLTFAIAFVAFGVATLLRGSGFLAVLVAGIVLGNAKIPYKTGVTRVHDAIAWLAQIALFFVLGLLARPERLLEVAGVGLALAFLLTVLARPLAVLLCLLPFRYPLRELAYLCWIGLRGAVPVVLATFPLIAGVPGAERIFDIIFFVVVLSAIVPGGTVSAATRLLRLTSREPLPPEAVLEIATTQPLRGELLSFYVERASAVAGSSLADLPFPETASVMLIVRGAELIAPRGRTTFEAGDHVYLFCAPEDRPLVQLIFGRLESS